MKLWTFQPQEVIDIVEKTGEFIADPNKSELVTEFDFGDAYNWLNGRMKKFINDENSNNDIKIPVWAWYKYNYKNIKPDRRIKLFNNYKNDRLLELDIDDSRVLLSDYNEWHSVLNNYPVLTMDEFEKSENDEILENFYMKDSFKIPSWDRIFDVGDKEFVQATFWKLLKEDIVKIY